MQSVRHPVNPLAGVEDHRWATVGLLSCNEFLLEIDANLCAFGNLAILPRVASWRTHGFEASPFDKIVIVVLARSNSNPLKTTATNP